MAFAATMLIGFIAACALTPVVRSFALRRGILDRPSLPRKLHQTPVPLLGGLAMVTAFLVAVGAALVFGWLPGTHIQPRYLAGLAAALGLLVLGGSLDDVHDLPPQKQIIWPLAAALIAIASGIGTDVITNPFGGLIYLGGFSAIFTFFWLMGMTYTTKFLDGLDGLVTGVSGIGALVIAAVSMMKEVSQPDTAILALAFAGVCAGFLVFNFHPAKIFLGEGGSTAAGFLLGVLAIISGGKIATTLLVLGLPILDAAVVILRRLIQGRSPVAADRSHLHFRLLDLGFTQRQTALFLYFIAAFFGASTLVLRGTEKLAALAVLASILVALVAGSMALLERGRKYEKK